MTTTGSASAILGKRKTFTQFNLEQHRLLANRKEGAVTGEFTQLLDGIQSACKVISMLVGKGPKLGVLGAASTENVQGEQQKTLDVLSNEVFISSNEYSGCLAGMVSEELEEFYTIPKEYPKGQYLLLFDPLDGSSNIPVNVSIGTIFSILRVPEGTTELDNKSFLQPGSKIVAAGYCVYGPQTTLMLSTGSGVNGFTLDQDVGEFFLSDPDVKVPESTKEFSINASNRKYWDPPVRTVVEEWEQGKDGPRGKDYNFRWVGSMVSDVHRILSRGGVFCYPCDDKLRKQGMTGRLRYLYEVAPMAYLMVQAGGAATTGTQPALDWEPDSLHCRAPIFLGSKEEIERIDQAYAAWQKDQK